MTIGGQTSASVGYHDFKGLRALADIAGAKFRRGIVLYTGREVAPFGPELYAVPLAALWQTA